MAEANDILFTGRLGSDPKLVTPTGDTVDGLPRKPFVAFDICQGKPQYAKWIGVRCYGERMQEVIQELGIGKGDSVRINGALSHTNRPCKKCKIPARYYFILARTLSLVFEKRPRGREDKKFRDVATGKKPSAKKPKPF